MEQERRDLGGKVEMIGEGSIEVEMLLTEQHSLSTFLIEKQSPCISNMAWVLKNTIILYAYE